MHRSIDNVKSFSPWRDSGLPLFIPLTSVYRMIIVIEVPLASAEAKPAKIKPKPLTQPGKIIKHGSVGGRR